MEVLLNGPSEACAPLGTNKVSDPFSTSEAKVIRTAQTKQVRPLPRAKQSSHQWHEQSVFNTQSEQLKITHYYFVIVTTVYRYL